MRRLLILPIALLSIALSGCGYNGAISDEAGIKAAWEDNMNVRDSMVKQISESMHVAESERASLAAAIEGYMSAQNPEDGRGQMMQWSQNAGVDVSGERFDRVIDILEAKRNEFQAANTRLRDKQRAYETSLGALPNGPILGMIGFPQALPTCDFSQTDPYCPPTDKDHDGVATVLDFPVIVSGSSKAVFATGQDDFTLGGE